MKTDYIFGEGKSALHAEADFEMKKQEVMDEYPEARLSHKTLFQKHGRHQVVQYVILERDEQDVVDSVLTRKVKRKGF